MSTEIKVPSLGESVVEATVAKWYKNQGDHVAIDGTTTSQCLWSTTCHFQV